MAHVECFSVCSLPPKCRVRWCSPAGDHARMRGALGCGGEQHTRRRDGRRPRPVGDGAHSAGKRRDGSSTNVVARGIGGCTCSARMPTHRPCFPRRRVASEAGEGAEAALKPSSTSLSGRERESSGLLARVKVDRGQRSSQSVSHPHPCLMLTVLARQGSRLTPQAKCVPAVCAGRHRLSRMGSSSLLRSDTPALRVESRIRSRI
jgi:hypothetical protein